MIKNVDNIIENYPEIYIYLSIYQCCFFLSLFLPLARLPIFIPVLNRGQLKNTLQEKSLQDSKFGLACWMVCFNMERGIHIFSFVISPQSRLFQSIHHWTLLGSLKK